MEPKTSRTGFWPLLAAFSLILIAAATCPQSKAQSYLYNRADFATGKSPSAVIAADFNGDGKPDLAVTNQGDNTVSILLGKPDATFAAQVTYATGTSPVSVVAADFNSDGKLDLAVVNSNPTGTGSISILLGNGDGTFQAQVPYSVGANPVGIVAADFNGDGKTDLAVANTADNTVSVLLGNGDGTFQSQTAVSVGTAPVAIAEGDFNKDGQPDLVTSNSGSQSLSILLCKGDGTFTRSDMSTITSPTGIAVGDFNGDGDADIVVASHNTSPIVLFGNGDGSFHTSNTGINSIYPKNIVVTGDFDHDGKLDLAFAGISYPFAQILRGNGDGTFSQASNSTVAASASSLFVADFNGDGLPDLAATSASADTVSILLGNGNCSFDSSVDFPVAAHQSVGPMLVTDLNGDGNSDLAWSLGYGPADEVNVMFGNGKGLLAGPTVTTLSAFAPAMVAGDFNGDGKTDLVVSELYTNAIALLPGNGDGTFGTAIQTSVPSAVDDGWMAAGDFNGDGKTDLAIFTDNATNTQFTLNIYFATSGGTFKAGPAIAALSSQGYVGVGDFNGDGKLDLAYAGFQTSTTGTLYVALGKGDGTFQTPSMSSIPDPSGPPVTADVNGDGNPDILVPAGVGFSTLLGNGDGTFQSQIYTQVSIGDVASHLSVADLNGDGKPDVAVSFPFSVLLGNGDGTFQAPRAYAAGGGAIGLGEGDFNSDGVPDLVLGNPVGSGNATADLFLSKPLANLWPVSLTFPATQVGMTSAPQTTTLTNLGSGPMSIASIAASGDFSETNDCGTTLHGASSCTVSVAFAPTAAGNRTGSISIKDGGPGSPQAVALSGTATLPAASVTPTSLDFGSEAVSSTSASQTVTLTNNSSAALSISSISLSGDFAQTNTCGASVAATSNCTISVTFTPTAVGARTGTLTISDAATGSPQQVALTGTGDDFSLTAASGSSTSASVSPGGNASYSLSLAPVDGFNQAVTLACTGAPSEATCTVSPASVTLDGTSSQSVTVSVSTTAASELPPAGPGEWPMTTWILLLGLAAISALAWRGRAGGKRGRSRGTALIPVGALLLFVALWAGCGGGGGGGSSSPPPNPGTPAGTYTLKLTATAGSSSHSANLTLTVQ